MFLVSVEQGFSSSNVVGQFVSIDQSLHFRYPAGEVTEICSKTLKPGKQDTTTNQSWPSGTQSSANLPKLRTLTDGNLYSIKK